MAMEYDPDFARSAGPQLQAQSVPLPLHDIKGRRDRMASFVAGMKSTLPDDVAQAIHQMPAADSHAITIYHLYKKSAPLSSSAPGPAVLHIHGGGYIGVSAEDSMPSLAEYVLHSGVPIFSVEYRLAPENPFPVPLEDCWAALVWLQSQAKTLNIDPARIAIMGESAGGGLAAGLAQVARDRALSPPLAKQILIYPMLDDRTRTDHTGGLAIFHVHDVVTGWSAYLGGAYGTDEVSPYAAAARITDVKGLAPLYLDIGQLDMFVHESWDFVQKFVTANHPTEFHLYPGVPHSFQRFAPTSAVAKRAFANRVGAIKSL